MQLSRRMQHVKQADHVADVGLEGDGVEACNDWLDEEGTKTPLVQHV